MYGRRRRTPLLGAALLIGGSRAVARGEVHRQQMSQETALNTQARLQWEAEQSRARDQQIANDAAKAALAEHASKQPPPESKQQSTQGSGKGRFCSNCGFRLPENARFCQDCGSQIQAGGGS